MTVNGKEIKSQWFMISEDADIKVNFAEIGAEPSVAFTVAPGQKMSFLLNTVDSNGTVEIDWGTGARTPYEGQNAYTSGSYQIGGTRIDGTAAGSTVTLYGDIAAVDASGFGDVAEDFGLWDNAITAVDLSGRGMLCYDLHVPTQKVGTFDTELVEAFLIALARRGDMTIHVRQLAGSNSHHIIEGAFKSLARSLGAAAAIDPRFSQEIPSTKGVL